MYILTYFRPQVNIGNKEELAFNAPSVLRKFSTPHEKPHILETTSANMVGNFELLNFFKFPSEKRHFEKLMGLWRNFEASFATLRVPESTLL